MTESTLCIVLLLMLIGGIFIGYIWRAVRNPIDPLDGFEERFFNHDRGSNP